MAAQHDAPSSGAGFRPYAAQQATYVRKAGWLWKRGRLNGRWVCRWYELSAFERSFRYSDGPSAELGREHAVMPGKVVSAKPLKPCTRSGHTMHGFLVSTSAGRSKQLFCESAAQRDSWVWYLNRLGRGLVHLTDRYQVDWHQLIGSGTYADVLRATDGETGEAVAVKVVSSLACQCYFDLMDKEVAVMHRIGQHPHLLGAREVFYSRHNIFIVTDFVGGGDLQTYARLAGASGGSGGGCFSEAEAAGVVRQLLLALAHLHAREIAHCDVKPENVLLGARDGVSCVRLIDYNSAVFFSEPTMPGGTPEYLAPELLQDDCEAGGCCAARDIWGLGVLTHWLLTGTTPFAADTIPHVLHNIQSGSTAWRGAGKLSEGAETFVAALLQPRPQDRPSAQQLLQHPWIAAAPAGSPGCVAALPASWADRRPASNSPSAARALAVRAVFKLGGKAAAAGLERLSAELAASPTGSLASLPSNLTVRVHPSLPFASAAAWAALPPEEERKLRLASPRSPPRTPTRGGRRGGAQRDAERCSPLDSVMSYHRLSVAASAKEQSPPASPWRRAAPAAAAAAAGPGA